MQQVATVFSGKRREISARKAAKVLGVCLSSFYKYAAGTDLPRMEVLKTAQEKWNVRWDLLDPTQVLRTRKAMSAEQLLLPWIRSVREEDVEVVSVGTGKDSSLRVILKIRFAASATAR